MTTHLPARDVPIPTLLSPQAQAQLARNPGIGNPPWPPQDDLPAWRTLIKNMDQTGLAGLTAMAQHVQAKVEEINTDGVRVYVVTPDGYPSDDQSVYLDIHGGALLWGGGQSCRALAVITAGMVGAKV